MTDLDHDLATEALPTHRDSDVKSGLAQASHAIARDGSRTGRRSMSAASVLALQRSVGNAGVVQALDSDHDDHASKGVQRESSVHGIVGKGGGSALDSGTRSRMESAFGESFGDVRVHSDSAAAASAKEVGAHAYTSGSDIVLGAGLDLANANGQRTLAHELTHVVQQRQGPVSGTPTGTGISVSHPSDHFEQQAEATADRIMSEQAAPVQRSGGPEEEEPVQGKWVQRSGGPEEEEPVQGKWVQRSAEHEGTEDEGEHAH